MAEGRLDVAQAGGERDVAERPDQAVGLVAAADVERDHGAEAVLEQAAGQVEIGVRREPGIMDAGDPRMRSRVAWPAPGRWRWRDAARRLSVARPRRASQLSNGLPVWPNVEATDRMRSIRSRGPATAPSVRSLWPPISLVTECMTNVAPSSSGRQSSGAKVWSTSTGTSRLAADPRDRFEVGDAEQGVGEGLGEDQPRVAR